ncbi:MAG TPA: sulfurtransferase TusA family protein [Verrucomicrobiae bacterium]|nr:sulfurtransferase TusA family protein [Verrucomicrobiae bacterium]
MRSAAPGSNDIQPPPRSNETPESLDLRGVQPPENVLAVLKRVSQLAPGAQLEIRLDSNPFQLYDLLQQRGFLLVVRQENGGYRGLVTPRDI